jgi:flagellar motor switch protein FliG
MVKKIKVDGGPKVATDMLAGLDPDSRKVVLEKMAAIDPELTEALKSQMISLDDLPKMTIKMLPDFLKRVVQSDLALALKICSQETQKFFIEKGNRSLSMDIKDTLSGQKVPKAKCIEAHDKVLIVVKEMVEEGRLILNSNDEYV